MGETEDLRADNPTGQRLEKVGVLSMECLTLFFARTRATSGSRMNASRCLKLVVVSSLLIS